MPDSSKVESIRALKAHFKAIGGFSTSKGHLYFIDPEECMMYAFNGKQNKVKVYTLGDGGTNWTETLDVSQFKTLFPAKK